MFKKRIFVLLLMFVLFVVSGCSNDQAQEDEGQNNQEKAIFYENSEAGIRVFEVSQWNLGKESTTGSFNVTFENNNVKAIVTILAKEKTTEEIKHELRTGAGKVSTIEETNDYLALKSERKESIRTDIYIKDIGLHTGVITFMTPTNEYETNREKINEFKRNIEFF